jgi:hypothetical protein
MNASLLIEKGGGVLAKPHKIKHYYDKQHTFKAPPRPLTVLLVLVLVAGLVLLGVSSYEPVKNFISELRNPEPPVADLPSEPPPPPAPSVSSAEPEPEPLPERAEQIRAVLMPHETAIYSSSWDTFLDTVPEDCNTILVETKNAEGLVLYNTKNDMAVQWGAVSESPMDLASLSGHLKERGYYLAVRISSFGDPLAARSGREETAVMHSSGVTWLDNTPQAGGKPWLNPYSKTARDYLTALSLECVEAGASYVLFDQFQFPQDPTGSAVYGETGNVSKQEMLIAFSREITALLEEKAARFSVYLPVGSVDIAETPYNRMAFGGDPLGIVPTEIALSMNIDFLAGATPESRLTGAIERAAPRVDSAGLRMLPVLAASETASLEQQVQVLTGLGFEEYILYQAVQPVQQVTESVN